MVRCPTCIGYVVSTFVSYLVPGVDLVAGLLVVPSIIGEFWIVGYLIVVGVHDHTSHATSSLEFSGHPEAAS